MATCKAAAVISTILPWLLVSTSLRHFRSLFLVQVNRILLDRHYRSHVHTLSAQSA